MYQRIWLMVALALLCSFTATAAYSKEYVVKQKNTAFYYDGSKASSIAIRVGDRIKFANEDTLFHNIFSMSKIMTFNLGAWGKGKSETVSFKKAGTVDIECAIHPKMRLEVVVK